MYNVLYIHNMTILKRKILSNHARPHELISPQKVI